MTQREQQTLALILRHVEQYHGKTINGVRVDQIQRVANQRLVGGGDYIIGKVEFRKSAA